MSLMLRVKLLLMAICVLTIMLDKFSFIGYVRDYFTVYVQKHVQVTLYRLKTYPYLFLLDTKKQRQLEQENVALRQRVERDSLLLQQQNNRGVDVSMLKALNNVSLLYNDTFDVIAARAVINTAYLTDDYLLIDKGSAARVRLGAAVINQTGVIGQVCDVNAANAKIMLITNPDFHIYLQTTNNHSKMLAQGIGNGHILARYINKSADLKIGDVLVTTGLDNTYPANIAVARISKIFYEDNGFDSALCDPVVDYNKLQYVMVLGNESE
jgi:rod shape-determining protein MreC